MAPSPRQRVLFIGWDAADWRILNPLMQRGLMPALSKLVEAGAHGNLATLQPALSPLLWTSIATGKTANRHGIHGFLEPCPDGSGVRPVSSTSRSTKALWNIAHQNGLKSHVVGWYASHPAEPIRGATVSDRFIAAGPPELDAGVQPEALRQVIGESWVRPDEIKLEDLAAFIPRLDQAKPEDQKYFSALTQLIARCATVQASATRLMLDDPDWDLSMVFFDGLDHLGHWFMPFHPPRRPGVDARQFDLFSGVIEAGYRFFDMMLESLLAHAGHDTTVLLASDHGFKSDGLRPAGSGWEKPVDWHRGLGIAVASGPGIKTGEALYGASVLDLTPTALRLLGLSSAMDMQGRAWLEVFDPPLTQDRVMSWDSVKGDDGQHAEDHREDPAAAAEVMQQLVDLGYIAPPSEDAATNIRQTQRDNRINLAIVLLSEKLHGEAADVINALLDEYPQDPLVLSLGSRLKLLQRDPVAVERLAQNALQYGERTATLLTLLAEAAVQRDDDTAAVSFYREAIELEAQGGANPGTYGRLGDALERQGHKKDAEAAYHAGLKIDPDHAPLRVGASRLALQRGDTASAFDHATRAVSLAHAYPAAHFQLGEALLAAGRAEDAVVAFGVCHDMSPQWGACIERLAELKTRLGHEDASAFQVRLKSSRRRAAAAGVSDPRSASGSSSTESPHASAH